MGLRTACSNPAKLEACETPEQLLQQWLKPEVIGSPTRLGRGAELEAHPFMYVYIIQALTHLQIATNCTGHYFAHWTSFVLPLHLVFF